MHHPLCQHRPHVPSKILLSFLDVVWVWGIDALSVRQEQQLLRLGSEVVHLLFLLELLDLVLDVALVSSVLKTWVS